MGWDFLVPQLPVRDVPAAQRWYAEKLGCEPSWIWEDTFGAVTNGEIEVFLIKEDKPQPVTCCVFVADVDSVYADYRERGAEICSDLESMPWNVREFTVRDPDGNMFRVGTSVEAAEWPHEITILDEAQR
jgi:catechol 2,3-dioxygenase-like lactoylglutathione lyase family enzyme